MAVHHDKGAERRAEAQQDEAVLAGRVIRIVDQQAVFVAEGGDGLLERNAVFAPVGGSLGGVPLEGPVAHGL